VEYNALQLPHELGEPIQVVGALEPLTGAENVVLLQEITAVLLKRIGVGACGTSVVEPLHPGLLGRFDGVVVDRKHLGALNLSGVHKLPPSEEGTKMKDSVGPLADDLELLSVGLQVEDFQGNLSNAMLMEDALEAGQFAVPDQGSARKLQFVHHKDVGPPL
jgi:hypothetical protein